MDDKQHKEREHFFSAAKLIAGITLVSRLLGMLRDMAVTSLGANEATGTFIVAYRIPNLFRRLFGEGALSAAFVPVLAETEKNEGQQSASRFVANVLGLLTVILMGLTLLVWAGLLLWYYFYGRRHGQAMEIHDANRLVTLTSIMLPFTITICLLGVAAGALNCRGHFSYPAAAPIILNVCMIAAVWWGGSYFSGNIDKQLTTLAMSVLIAGAIQLAGMLWMLRRTGFSLRWRLRPVEPGIRTMLPVMASMLLGMSLPQISSFLESIIIKTFSAGQSVMTGSIFGHSYTLPLPAGAQTHVYAAGQLYQFPMGVLAISLGVAVFPLLSRYAARNDMANLRESINRALRLAFMEGLASGVGLFVLAEPIVQLIYARRKFTLDDAASAAFILKLYVLGMWAYCVFQIFLKSFYALKEPNRPLRVVSAMAMLNIVLVLTLIWVPGLGSGAVGLSTAITMSISVLTLAAMLRKRLGRFGGRKLAMSVARTLVSCAAMAASIYLLRWLLGPVAAWKTVALCVPFGGGVFVLTAYLLRSPELGELFGALRKRPA